MISAVRDFDLPTEAPSGFTELEVRIHRRWFRLSRCAPKKIAGWAPFFLITVDGDPLGTSDEWRVAVELFQAFVRAARK